MERCFDICYENNVVGTVQIHKEGLYYKICCRIKLPGMRLLLRTSEAVIDLGLCVPSENTYSISTSRSVKSVQGIIQEFFLIPYNGRRYLIDSMQPFLYLKDLSAGKLQVVENRYYFVMPNQQ